MKWALYLNHPVQQYPKIQDSLHYKNYHYLDHFQHLPLHLPENICILNSQQHSNLFEYLTFINKFCQTTNSKDLAAPLMHTANQRYNETVLSDKLESRISRFISII